MHLKDLALPDRKVSRKRQVQLKDARAFQVVVAQVAVRSEIRWDEGWCGVPNGRTRGSGNEPMVYTLVGRIRIRIHQIRGLESVRGTYCGQCAVCAGNNGEKLSRLDFQVRSKLPVARQNPHQTA